MRPLLLLTLSIDSTKGKMKCSGWLVEIFFQKYFYLLSYWILILKVSAQVKIGVKLNNLAKSFLKVENGS